MVRKLTLSGLVIAMYVVIMYFTQGFAFGQYQIRIATALYGLCALFPFLIVPMAVANCLSNMLMGGLGLPDMIGGAVVGMTTAAAVRSVSGQGLGDWWLAVPIIFGPGLLVPLWLSPIIQVPYEALAISITIGQIIPAVAGVLLVKQLRKNGAVHRGMV